MILEKYKSCKNGFTAICKCDCCGKEFETKYFKIKKSKHQYCSLECSWSYYKSEEFSKTMSLATTGIHCTKGKRSIETREKISLAKQGEKHWHWNGGKRIKSGYVLIKSHNHLFADSQDYIREHRLVMEKFLGRYLTKEEVVHHVNGDRTDNRIENLMLFDSTGDHVRFHKQNKKALVQVY